jgi:catechol 2,3-dioxygenase-like lactoylglutathione lyase family enzyme
VKFVQVRRLCFFSTRTGNYTETKDFFTSVLGLDLVTDEKDFSSFQLASGRNDYVELFGIDHPDGELMTTGPVPGLLVDDVAEARAELEAAGVEILDPIRWMADVDQALVDANPELADYCWFQFRGPDGNVYCCIQHSQGGVE